MYVVREKGIFREVEEIVTHFIVTCDDESSLAAPKSVSYIKGLRAAVAFFLKVKGVNIVT